MRSPVKETSLFWNTERKSDCFIANSISDSLVAVGQKMWQLISQFAPKKASKLRSLNSTL